MVFYYIFENGTQILDEGREVAVVDQYRLVDSTGQRIPGQHDIIPTGGAFTSTYSDLREIVEVTVPDDYEANSLTSVEALQAEGLLQPDNIIRTGVTINAPLAFPGSQLQGRDRDLITLWEGDSTVVAFDFGPTSRRTAPIFKFIFGFDDDGNPIPTGWEIDSVIRQMHRDPGYSDFWQVFMVTVPEDTPPNSIRSYEQVVAAGYPIQETSTVINCPAIPLERTTVAYHNDVAYHVTQIDRPDLAVPASIAPAYNFRYDDGTELVNRPWVLAAIPGDENYTGYCERVHVLNALQVLTSTSAIANSPRTVLRPQDTLTTCAVLWRALPPLN
jgi:hypothetical protein